MTDGGFAALARYVEEQLDFATSHYNDSYLDRRFSSRVRRTDSDNYEEYLDLLRSDPSEQEELLDALSINVTGFFRNPEVWDGIRTILQDLTANNRRVNVWSAACADGREPYSISMLAHDDPEIDASALSILATDINEKALEDAQVGRYRSSRTVDIADQLEYLQDYTPYIERNDDQFTISDTVRSPVTFRHHDLINGEPKSGFDLVLCRNLFIYISNEYKVPVLRTVAESLDMNRYLVIGKAETIPPELQDAFSTVDSRLRIYRSIN